MPYPQRRSRAGRHAHTVPFEYKMKLAHCNGLQRANPNIQRLFVFPGGGAAYLTSRSARGGSAHSGNAHPYRTQRCFLHRPPPRPSCTHFLKMHADAINITRPVLRHIGCGEGEHACRESDEIDEYLFFAGGSFCLQCAALSHCGRRPSAPAAPLARTSPSNPQRESSALLLP